jgi:chemotaxis protein methyltransferase CheR
MTATADDVRRFASAVEAQLGFRVGDRPAAMVEVIDRRARAHRLTPAAYLDRLAGAEPDPDELRALIAEISVGETYFFRHAEQIQAYADLLPELVLRRAHVRVLSAGCSSGEEPYTLAMVARELIPDPGAIAVHGIDFNPAALARAAAGRYTRWALRATTPEHERRWFTPAGKDAVIAGALRAAVTFTEANLITDRGAWASQLWDVIFCRNVIMYFSSEHARAVVERLIRMLAPGGYLFLGHAETLHEVPASLELCHTHGTFYYQRTASPVRSIAPVRPTPVGLRAVAAPPAREPGRAPPDAAWVDDIAASSGRINALVDDALARSSASRAIPDAGGGPGAAELDDRSGDAPDDRSGERSGHAPHVAPAPALGLDVIAADPVPAIRALVADERFAEALARLAALPAPIAASPDALRLRAVVLVQTGGLAEARAACDALAALDPRSASTHYLLAVCTDAADPAASERHARDALALDPGFAMARIQLAFLARRAGDATALSHFAEAIALLEREDPVRLALYGGGFSRDALIALCRAELAPRRRP